MGGAHGESSFGLNFMRQTFWFDVFENFVVFILAMLGGWIGVLTLVIILTVDVFLYVKVVFIRDTDLPKYIGSGIVAYLEELIYG